MGKIVLYPNNTESPDEMLKSLAIREGDTTGQRFMQYKGVAPDVYRDMNLYSLKYTKRYYAEIDKNTNSIFVQDDFLFMSSVSIVDECNKIKTLSINQSLSDDIIDMSLDKDCHCECGCNSDLCGQIKSYEPIVTETEEELPGGGTQVFQSITRKRVAANGKFYTERTFPVRKYGEDGEWVSVELETETEELCSLEVDKCGCVKSSEDNVCKVNTCCNADTFEEECGCSTLPRPKLAYGISELNNRIIFPSTLGYDKAIVRYYAECSVKDMRIPMVAKEAFLSGIKALTLPYDERQPMWRIKSFERKYQDEKEKLFTLLNRFSFKEINQVLNPYRVFP